MELIRKDLEMTNQEKDEMRSQLDGLQKKIDDVKKEIDEVYKKKDEIHSAYWKARYDCKKQEMEISHIRWMQRQKDKVVQNEQYKKERE